MREYTRKLFWKPIVFQEGITYVVLAPIMFFLFLTLDSIRNNLATVITLVGLSQVLIALPLGLWSKYHFIRPAIDHMHGARTDRRLEQRAIRHAAILPFAEAIVIFLRWSLIMWCTVVLPLYLKGCFSVNEVVYSLIVYPMIGGSSALFYFLAAENSLFPFYRECRLTEVMEDRLKVPRANLNAKVLGTILLIALPPIGLFLGTIYLSVATGMDIKTFAAGFVFITIQTVFMTFLNGLMLMRGLSLSIGRMTFMFEDMAKGQGDLTKRLEVVALNETGRLSYWFNSFMNDIENIVAHVKGNTLELDQSVGEVNGGSQNLSQTTQEQAAAIEEIAAAIEQMAGAIKQTADLTNEGRASSEMVTTMIERNRELFSNLAAAIKEISSDSNKIGEIVSTVNEVAFHTNLLALNASVEAARAGEHGKGFAVVASEVRSLAQRSAGAAGEIKSLIENTVSRMQVGDHLMVQSRESLEELMAQMETFFSMMANINTASVEQANGIGEINRAILQIDTSTQQNASTVEELASTIDSITAVTSSLASDVRKFKVSE